LELFSLEEKVALLPGGLFVFAQVLFRTPLREQLWTDCVPFVEGCLFEKIPEIRGEPIMYCDACGTAVHPGQGFCSRCGKQIIGPIASARARRRVQDHIHLLSIFWFAISAFNSIIGVVLYIIANTLLAPGGAANAPEFVRPLLSVLAIIILGGSALGFCAGWGLMHREPWARTLTLVLGFLVLFINIPIGTAVGVYTLWVLLPAESEHEYGALVLTRAA
jgi:predicted nucleic acid-binding Zn ribbon protein